MIYPITPVPKPRMTQRDKWAKRPAVLRYRAFADEVRAHGVIIPEDGATVVFTLPMPKSWSKKKRAAMQGKAHTQTPDWDNLAKALCDAVHGDDSHLHTVAVRKVWGQQGSIEIRKWNWGDPWPGELDQIDTEAGS